MDPSAPVQPVVLHEVELCTDMWDDDVRGTVRFLNVFSADRTPTRDFTSGLGEIPPGGRFALHRHSPAELYHVVAGEGEALLDGTTHRVGAGSSFYVPGGVEHGVRNVGPSTLRVFYVLATDSLQDVDYRFSAVDGHED